MLISADVHKTSLRMALNYESKTTVQVRLIKGVNNKFKYIPSHQSTKESVIRYIIVI